MNPLIFIGIYAIGCIMAVICCLTYGKIKEKRYLSRRERTLMTMLTVLLMPTMVSVLSV